MTEVKATFTTPGNGKIRCTKSELAAKLREEVPFRSVQMSEQIAALVRLAYATPGPLKHRDDYLDVDLDVTPDPEPEARCLDHTPHTPHGTCDGAPMPELEEPEEVTLAALDPATKEALARLEAVWLTTCTDLEYSDSLRNIVAEQKAYDAYTGACSEAGVCYQAGCWNATTWNAYCPPHRD